MPVAQADVLSSEQIDQYHQDGFLLVSGLVGEDVARRGEDAMWEVMGMDRTDPSTWTEFGEDARESTVAAGFNPQDGLFQYFRERSSRSAGLLYARHDGGYGTTNG